LKPYAPYASLERVIEENKDLYYKALRRTQTTLKNDEADWEPWIGFFLRCLKKQKDSLAARLDQERQAQGSDEGLPELAVQMLALFKTSERLTLAQMEEQLGANRNTLKVRLRELVAAGRLKRHGKARATWYTVRVDGDNVIAQFLVSAAMVLVLLAVTEQGLVELVDMVFRQAQIFIGLEHQVHCLGVARDLLLVAGREGLHFDVGEKRFDLSIGELCSFNAGGRTDAFDGRDLAQGFQAIWRQGFEGVPTPLELINLRDEFDHVLAYGECWFPHRDRAGISDFIPDYTQLYPILLTRVRTPYPDPGSGSPPRDQSAPPLTLLDSK
jgi:hypothetical protein